MSSRESGVLSQVSSTSQYMVRQTPLAYFCHAQISTFPCFYANQLQTIKNIQMIFYDQCERLICTCRIYYVQNI